MSDSGKESEQPCNQTMVNPEAREQKLNEKGLAYRISLLESNYKTALSSWRRRSNKLSVLMADCQDVTLLREHRDKVENALEELRIGVDQLQGLKDNVIAETEKLEQVESDHQNLMRSICECIREIESQKYEIASNASSKSSCSKSSRSSRTSRISNMSRISDAAVRKAALQTKLKYIDIESKLKAEWQKIRTIKKLEMAGAEQAALEEVLDHSDVKSDTFPISLPQGDSKDYIKGYVETHAESPVDVKPLVSEWSQHISFTEPQPSAFMALPQDNLEINTPLISNAIPRSDMSPTSGVAQTIATVCAGAYSLNPTTPPFNPAFAKPAIVQSSWVYKGALPATSYPLVPSSTSVELVNLSAVGSANFTSTGNYAIQGNIISSVTTSVASSSSGSSTSSKAEQGLIELAKTLADQVSLSRLPSPEPSIFSGDPLSYPSWKSAFQILIEQRKIPLSERIHYLKPYVSGQVRDVIEGYFLLPSDRAFVEAKKTLDKRYGDPFVISNAFRDKLERWPKISPRDGTGLRKFSDFLQQCQIAMQTISSLSVLNDDRENRKLLTKLPDWMVSRWGRVVSRWKEERLQFPPYCEFVDFVAKEATIACDPVTSLQSLKGVNDSQKSDKVSNRQERVSHGSRTFLAEVEERDKKFSDNACQVLCALCNGPHELDDCRAFLDKSLAERKSFVKEKGLCFACLQGGHVSKKCRRRKKCKTCSKFHPSSLHGDKRMPSKQGNRNDSNPKNSEGDTAAKTHLSGHAGAVSLSNLDKCRKCSMIVPVYVSHCDFPGKERLVYALLDTQSDTTFILEETCDALGLSGAEVRLSLSTMYASNKMVTSTKIKGLVVRGVNNGPRINLSNVYTRSIMPANHNHIPTSNIAEMWPHLEGIADQIGPLRDCEIGLLIGYNCPRALAPREVVAPNEEGPYGLKTDLGWSIVGIVDVESCAEDQIGLSHRILSQELPLDLDDSMSSSVMFSVRTKVKEVVSSDILKVMERDFIEFAISDVKYSQEDKQFVRTLTNGIHFVNGHYEMPLPFRGHEPSLPNNRTYALKRLSSLRRRLERDETYRQHYSQFMNDLLKNNHAELVPRNEMVPERGCVWYIPHHGVYHPQKLDKVRIVFDCSAQFQGESLNSHLLQGPDLTNKLIGVLCRFRRDPIAITCDVEKMFHQFKVSPCHRNYLRFLWWSDGDLRAETQEYRMTVHLFGATSSPGCANFAFKQMAEDYQDEFGPDAAEFIRRDFYVDDGLKSVSGVDEAIKLIDNTKSMCTKGGLRLHKFISNNKDVIQHLETEDMAMDLRDVNLALDKLPVERTLGILWCIESDAFQFRIVLNDCPLTRHGILSTVCSMYDPLGYISPVILIGKQILQEMCADNLDWDDPLPEKLYSRWDKWRSGLKDLTMIKIQRCVKPKDFGTVTVAEMHHFSDASTSGYGQCSFLRLINESDRVHCSLLLGKSRVTPLKPITIPRLELSAALLSVKIASFLDQELDFKGLSVSHFYWTDSKVVIGYLLNEARRFHVFVANRIQQIRERTKSSQWQYVSSKQNPADIASRGATAREIHSESKWFNGPDFLWERELPDRIDVPSEVNPDDPEIKQSQCFTTKTEPVQFSSVIDRLQYFSDWYRAKRAVAVCLRFIDQLRQKLIKKPSQVEISQNKCPSKFQHATVSELQRAETMIVKCVQMHHFSHDIKCLKFNEIIEVPSSRKELIARHKVLNGKSQLHKLDPFLDQNGLLRVGGRLQNAELSDLVKHPVVLPRKSRITDLVIRHFHCNVLHQGRGITTQEIRTNGFWIVGCSSAVSSFILNCVLCRRLRGSTQGQKMADLPSDRLKPSPPFTFCAVDLFGPWFIKEGRKELKRYGVLFTCLACRAIHVETSNSLSTDSFINSLRRFIAIRGPIRQLRSDRGTNFVGAEQELKEAFMELDEERISQFLLKENCDLVNFKMNVPSASHMGGVWERQIRSVRNVMSALLHHHGSQLDDEGLRTFLYEAAAIVNGRPLTVDTLNDPLSSPPLSPNLLLTMKTNVILPPPGNFQKSDIYSRKHWRRVQYLLNQFWARWRSEYIQNLTLRSKWNLPRRNLSVGDVVLLKEDNQPRNEWSLCRVTEVMTGDDGLVRKATVAIGQPDLDSKGRRKSKISYLERPVHKLVLLKETEEIPIEEP